MGDGILAQLGIDASVAFAGLAGGVVGAWADGKATIGLWFAYVISGSLTAIYLADGLNHILPFTVGRPTAGFLVGTSALVIVRAIIATARRWQPNLFNGGRNSSGKVQQP